MLVSEEKPIQPSRVTIREESPADYDGIDAVNQFAFGGSDEADVIHRLRNAGLVITSLVAEREGDTVGHILFSQLPIKTERGTVAAVALGPMAVLPDYQKRGIGAA